MKNLLFILALAVGGAAFGKEFSFKYVHQQNTFTVTIKELTFEAAYKKAAKECFQKLTGGKYPGAEKGLEIIDICANPR